ncbi:MAG: hypothetical protein EZS28_039768 [Streblomastix strix]|uniref:DDE-1 domain-containing protein n=1 Tax=Streblomastix strix TaxID=222440 RepID=A0A5J4U4X1_9EUKA|nr:MAG: hypothetical protein EZS28_039768 [Streblomastix strix]
MIIKSIGTTLTGDFFVIWLLECAVPFVNKLREYIDLNLRLAATLLIDNCTCHLSPEAKQTCLLDNIKLITLPLNSTQYLQVHDLGIFGIFRSHLQTLRRRNIYDSPETIQKVGISVLYQSLAPINGHKSFEKAGFERKPHANGHYYSSVHDEIFENIMLVLMAEHALLIYVGTRITCNRKLKSFGSINEEQLKKILFIEFYF